MFCANLQSLSNSKSLPENILGQQQNQLEHGVTLIDLLEIMGCW